MGSGLGQAKWLKMIELDELIHAHRIDFSVSKEVKRFVKVDLVVIDDIGLLPVSESAAEGLYRIIEACYEVTSVALSTNMHPSQFDKIMPPGLATAMVDRLMYHANVIVTSGQSIRMWQATHHQHMTDKQPD